MVVLVALPTVRFGRAFENDVLPGRRGEAVDDDGLRRIGAGDLSVRVPVITTASA